MAMFNSYVSLPEGKRYPLVSINSRAHPQSLMVKAPYIPKYL